MANEDQFCDDYLTLKPKDAGLLDLLLLLFSSDLKKRSFIECPEGVRLTNFRHRWIIFISVVAQRALLLLRTPMTVVGNVIELWLNLLSGDGGLLKLLISILTGRLTIPDRSSATFTSLVGNLDTRVDLDRSIKPNNRKYYASLSLMASKLSYENEAFINSIVTDHWQMQFLRFFDFWNDYQKRYSTQAFLLQDTRANPHVIVVAFRGTEPFDADDWCTDVDVSWYGIPNVGKVHGGFMKALGLQTNQGWPKEIDKEKLISDHPFAYYTIRKMLRELLEKNMGAKFILTGHSLGGALAVLFVSVLVLHEETWLLERLEGVYTFGQPRVGDRKFGKFMNKNLEKYDVNYWRYVYSNDIVPRLPYDDRTLLFKHFGPCLYFNSCYEGKVVKEEPNKNYFNLVWAAPKYVHALWELIRSFILPYAKGPEYRESWLFIAARMVGLVIPGLPAHSLQDYDNATRLDSLPFNLQFEDTFHY